MSSEDMEMLSGMAQSLFSSMGQKEEKEENSSSPEKNGDTLSSFNIDFETLSRIMSIMEKLNRQPDDPRYNLLLSLKPMLSEKKQGKIDEALRIMSLLSLLPLIGELGGNTNG